MSYYAKHIFFCCNIDEIIEEHLQHGRVVERLRM
jgi:hypothetical protein